MILWCHYQVITNPGLISCVCRVSWFYCTCCLAGKQYTIGFLRFCKQVRSALELSLVIMISFSSNVPSVIYHRTWYLCFYTVSNDDGYDTSCHTVVQGAIPDMNDYWWKNLFAYSDSFKMPYALLQNTHYVSMPIARIGLWSLICTIQLFSINVEIIVIVERSWCIAIIFAHQTIIYLNFYRGAFSTKFSTKDTCMQMIFILGCFTWVVSLVCNIAL